MDTTNPHPDSEGPQEPRDETTEIPTADSTPPAIPRWHLGFAGEMGRPTGDFKELAGNAGGLQAHLRVRLDQYGLVSLRVQAGWLNYGHESNPTCLATTPGCRVEVNVTVVIRSKDWVHVYLAEMVQ